MMSLTIVMYHYVRRISESRYPSIKGLERDRFIEQIRYLKRHYEPVTAQQVIEATREGYKLPPNAVLLTFDDGYIDHFANVFPVLHKERLRGCFFPPAKCILERTVLDVNKIHFILAAMPDTSKIVAAINSAIESSGNEFELNTTKSYRDKYAIADRFDAAEVIYIKRMLQVGLPEGLRSKIVSELFRQFVSSDEKSFANELYMDSDQLQCLVDAGMTVGSHGYDHCWLDNSDRHIQEQEVALSLDFLNGFGVGRKDWTMCYPYGAWNDSLLQILRNSGCALGFTTEVDVARIGSHDPLRLPRLDTNDLPQSGIAEA